MLRPHTQHLHTKQLTANKSTNAALRFPTMGPSWAMMRAAARAWSAGSQSLAGLGGREQLLSGGASRRTLVARASLQPAAAAPAAASAVSVAATQQQQQQQGAGYTLEAFPWDHSFVRELPGDPDTRNTLRQVHGALYSRVHPTPASGEPYLVSCSREAAQLIGLDPAECERPEFPLLLSGAAPIPGAEPYAQCYGGHQFGQWAGQLGDGRAITLGEVLVPTSLSPPPSPATSATNGTSSSGSTAAADGEEGDEGEVGAGGRRYRRWELQLKGAGKTPYSRRADGRAVLRSSLREFVASEAMAALGVPTTRALCLVGTGDQVMRDMFYDGNAKWEPGAVVCRVAPSFVRFGTFQLPASRSEGQERLVRQLADYVIRHHYPHLLRPGADATQQQQQQQQGEAEGAVVDHEVYEALFDEVCARSGRLVAMWQAVGFVHGVLNTDNCSILGLTLDYGPYGFLDRFDPFYTPNTTDFSGRRYAFRAQPEAMQFNLVMLANALLVSGLVRKEPAEQSIGRFSEVLSEEYNGRMAAKLGLERYDRTLSVELVKLMYEDKADFTNTFRALCEIPAASGTAAPLASLPARLRAALGKPPEEFTPDREAAWLAWLSAYQAKLREQGVPDEVRQERQRLANPKFIPRQHLLQYAIEAATVGDYSELEALMDVLRRPYDEQPDADPKYSSPPPEEMVRPGVCVLSCSS